VEVTLTTSNNTIIRAVLIFAEGIFEVRIKIFLGKSLKENSKFKLKDGQFLKRK